jgi:hypothetical protein
VITCPALFAGGRMMAAQMTVWRQRRLSRGWDPTQLIGRMKILATRDGVTLPATWLMVQVLFLWENGRAPVTGYHASLLARALDPATWVPTSRPHSAG